MALKDLRKSHPGLAKKIAPTKAQQAAEAKRKAAKGG